MMRSAMKFGVTLACAGGLVVASCAHDDSTLYVVGVQAPPGGECTYKNDPTQPQLFNGTIDVAFLASYRPVVLVGNQMIQQGRSDGFRTETSRIALQGAVVTVEDSEGTQLDSFTTLSSGIVDPSSGTTPGFGLISPTLVSPDVVTRLRTGKFPDGSADAANLIPPGGTKRLVVRFKVFGQTLGGQSVESNEAQFPVNACNGCLVFFPLDANDPSDIYPQPNCRKVGESTSIKAPCLFGQDEAIDCRLCSNSPLCQPGQL